MHCGNFNLVLHSHLPYVLNHGKWPHGEDWLFEAIAECYLPLIKITEELIKAGIKPKYTISFSPILAYQLDDKELLQKFFKYCYQKIEEARKDEIRFIKSKEAQEKINMAIYWQDFYQTAIYQIQNLPNSSLISKFKTFQDNEYIEIMTCAITHGYLPLLGDDRDVENQIKLAKKSYNHLFDREPKGIWLPECGYRPAYNWTSALPIHPFNQFKYRYGVEELLDKYDFNYFFTDQKVLLGSELIGDKFGNKSTPLNSLNLYNVVSKFPKEGGQATVFTRHIDLAMQVWSGELGYPGEPDYLDFHKKEGTSMLRYWKVTDTKLDMLYKELYNPDWIADKIDKQTHHFIGNLEKTALHHYGTTGKIANIALPFDTELFGHWWFEGPQFIKKLISGLHNSPFILKTTANESFLFNSERDYIHLSEGSWGKENNHSVWINPGTNWCWEMIYNSERKFYDTVNNLKDKNSKRVNSILAQTYKCLMLLLSSDWEFLIENGSARDYAEMRITNHYSDFLRLLEYAKKIDSKAKLSIEEKKDITNIIKRDGIFPEINFNDIVNE